MATVDGFNALKAQAMLLKGRLNSANAIRSRLGLPAITVPRSEQIGNFMPIQLSEDPFEADGQYARLDRYIHVLEGLVDQAKYGNHEQGSIGAYGVLLVGAAALALLMIS